MLEAATRLENILSLIPSQLSTYTAEEVSYKREPGKWSKKELLGHLIDSAANNHQRFVRMQIENNLNLPQYQQDEWVSIQCYHQREWQDLILLWKAYNEQLLYILKNIDNSKLSNTAFFPEYGPKSLQWIIDDYIKHMEHHFKQLLN